MKTMIEGYRIYPGEHCGSASMRGLLQHYCGLELPEPAVFGLAAGLECVFVESATMDPRIGVFGRSMSLEQDLGRMLEIDYREQIEDDDSHAWQVVREEVLAGRPTMLSGDILYLDYREYKVHFPGHRFVLLGFDDEIQKAFIADRIRPVPEACSYGALMTSRNPPEGRSTRNLWGKFHGTDVGRSLHDAARLAIRTCAVRMLAGGEFGTGDGGRGASGVAGIRMLAESLPRWAAREDAGWLASFNARCIEKFGNGGGNFRRLYAGFLSWAHALDPALVPAGAAALATQAADGWTAVSAALASASARGESGVSGEGGTTAGAADAFAKAAAEARRIADLEQRLFEQLAERA